MNEDERTGINNKKVQVDIHLIDRKRQYTYIYGLLNKNLENRFFATMEKITFHFMQVKHYI